MEQEQAVIDSADDEPVVATIVPPVASPWQFGLKSLLGLMVVCGVQFALMRYLTVLGGLGLAVGLCFLALAVLLVWAVLFARSGSPLMERLDFVGIRLVLAITVLLIGTIIAASGTAVFHSVGTMFRAIDLDKDIGVRTVRTQVWDGTRTYPALKVLVVYPGSSAQLAGIKIGEAIIVNEGTIDQFYETMHEQRGKSMTISIAFPTATGSIESSPPRSVQVTVPK